MKHSFLLASALALVSTGALAALDHEVTTTFDVHEALERGQELYEEIGTCVTCHGSNGEGGIGPALNIDGALPTDLIYQLQSNPQMAGIEDMIAPLNARDLVALSAYIRKLADQSLDEEAQGALISSAQAAMRGLISVNDGVMSSYDHAIKELETWSSVADGWERKADLGSIKSHYEMRLIEEFDAGEQKFFPEPGKTYWIENTGISTNMFGPSTNPVGADSSQVVVGDTDTKEIVASYKLPRELRGDVHTTFASPDGKYIYINGIKPRGNLSEAQRLEGPSTLLKVDALTLQPIASFEIGGRIHHGQIFRDKYLLIDTFGRDPDGLDVFLLDPETDEIIGGVRDEQLGGSTYTAFTDNEFIYVLMEPGGYATPAMTGYLAGLQMKAGDLVAMRPFWIAKLDPDTWEVVDEFPYPGYRANWVTIDSNSEFLYLPTGASSLVTKLDAKTGEKIWSSPTGIGPYGAALTADEKELWVADKGETTRMFGRTVTVIDAEAGTPLETLFSGYQVDHILLSPNGKEMWGTSNGEGRIYVWDVATREQITVIDMPEHGDAHGLVWVHYDEDGNSRVVRDQGNFHNGIHPAKGMPLN